MAVIIHMNNCVCAYPFTGNIKSQEIRVLQNNYSTIILQNTAHDFNKKNYTHTRRNKYIKLLLLKCCFLRPTFLENLTRC